MEFNWSFSLAYVLGLLTLLVLAYFQRTKFFRKSSLVGQVVIITGSSVGIGKETAKGLAQLGATIVFSGRSKQRTQDVMDQIEEDTGNTRLEFMMLDLSDLSSIHRFSKEFHNKFQRLDMLINNASIAETKISFDDEGHELHLKINHLGHFLLTHLLMDLLIATPKSRIINVSSITHEFITEPVNFTEAYYGNYSNPLQPHAVSKYANILFTHELQKRLDKKSVLVKTVVLHPGIVIPNHKAHLNEIQGASNTLYTALLPFEDLHSGGYYKDQQLSQCSKFAYQNDQSDALWRFSEEVLAVKTIV